MEGSGPQQPAGWYPNPNGGGQRYWDGMRWTEHTSGVQQVPPPMYQQPPVYQQPLKQKGGGSTVLR
jgi:hypothetical protein